MPRLRLPDGAELHWQERGEGPSVVIAQQFFAPTSVFGGLIDLLSRDHRVITYDPRGVGQSTKVGPYHVTTDAHDLAALTDETCRHSTVLVAMADGCNRAVKAAALRPDLVRAVVCVAGNPVGRTAIEDGEGLASSDSVVEALLSMMETDYRSALRTMISTANPNLDDDAVRERVTASADRCPQEAAAPRMRSWIEDEALEVSREVGDRLWMLEDGSNPWFLETTRRTAELLPEAHVHLVENGAVSRPEIAVSFISELTGVAARR
jgi:pimeloyl-ACP methyl ester carboxylesterase